MENRRAIIQHSDEDTYSDDLKDPTLPKKKRKRPPWPEVDVSKYVEEAER
jgi:hypothetical protein